MSRLDTSTSPVSLNQGARRHELARRGLIAVLMGVGGIVLFRLSAGVATVPRSLDEIISQVETEPDLLVMAGLRLILVAVATQLALVGALALVSASTASLAPRSLLTTMATGPARWVAGAALSGALLMPRPVVHEKIPDPLVIEIDSPATGSPADPGPETPGEQRSNEQAPPGRTPADQPPVSPDPAPDPLVLTLLDEDRPDANETAVAGTWIVRPGDHLWAIAEHQVTTIEGEATEKAVAAYWLELIEANQDRLIVPSDPDLIFPGQELTLPRIDTESG